MRPSIVRERPFLPQNEIAADTAGATAEKFASNKTATKNCADMILRIFLGGLGGSGAKPQSGQPGPGGTHCPVVVH